MTLTPDDFADFFQEVYGYEPFPWQIRLLRQVAQTGKWPETLALPTGSGKTTAIDIAVFHLAIEADRGTARRAPVRIAFVVDRRLVVDDAHKHARGRLGAHALAADGALLDGRSDRIAPSVPRLWRFRLHEAGPCRPHRIGLPDPA
jgi:CRISPR-associated endonuclease/helicase Cas3